MTHESPAAGQPLRQPHHSAAQLDHLAEMLKERIYATLALLAVMISLNPAHLTPLTAAIDVGGTALSLWAATVVSSQLAYRLVHQRLMGRRESLRQQRVQAPLLLTAVAPLILIGAAQIGIFGLKTALDIGIIGSVLTLVLWSLGSARAMGASGLFMLVVAGLEALIGLAVVGLKLVASH